MEAETRRFQPPNGAFLTAVVGRSRPLATGHGSFGGKVKSLRRQVVR